MSLQYILLWIASPLAMHHLPVSGIWGFFQSTPGYDCDLQHSPSPGWILQMGTDIASASSGLSQEIQLLMLQSPKWDRSWAGKQFATLWILSGFKWAKSFQCKWCLVTARQCLLQWPSSSASGHLGAIRGMENQTCWPVFLFLLIQGCASPFRGEALSAQG